ncbi:hypothetical protein STEG23_026919 [Scotinomys teguina]
MGISQDNWRKRRKTGGKRKPYHKKRKYELGWPAANTKIGSTGIHTVRVRGGKGRSALQLRLLTIADMEPELAISYDQISSQPNCHQRGFIQMLTQSQTLDEIQGIL